LKLNINTITYYHQLGNVLMLFLTMYPE